MTIVVTKSGSKARIVRPSGFQEEALLQDYIQKNPEVIPVHQIDETKKLLILTRELPTASGPVDAIAIDNDGDPYIIETKLYKNPDKRKVIAQVLDYGAALWANEVDLPMLLELADREMTETFGLSFPEKVKEFFGLEQEKIGDLVSSLERNLKSGRLKFVVLMDKIDQRLKDLILFVNENSKFDIYGVQLKHYKLDDYEIVVPELFGTDVKKDYTPKSPRIAWDESSFFEDLKARAGDQDVDIARKILDWCASKGFKVQWGKGTRVGTFYPEAETSGKAVGLFGVFSNGRVEIIFKDKPLNDQRKTEMIREFNSIGMISIKEAAINTWASFPLSHLGDKGNIERFLGIIESYLVSGS